MIFAVSIQAIIMVHLGTPAQSIPLLPNSALLGHTGFVGSNLKQQVRCMDFYNSKNIAHIHGREYDTVICSAVPAEKWKANRDPEGDKLTIERLCKDLQHVKANFFICISTIDVFPTMTHANEDYSPMENETHHAYGTNRLAFERFVEKEFPNHLILRLPALFGPFMKKNYLYDLMNDNLGTWIKQNTLFQWYPLQWLWRDIQCVIDFNSRVGADETLKVVNLFPEPLHTCDIVDQLFPHQKSKLSPMSEAPNARENPDYLYDLQTKYGSSVFGCSNPNYTAMKEDVFAEMKSFVESYDKNSKL